MRRLRTIDELYEQVKGYDLVITNDVSLETALNSRISTPRIGPLAMTPRHIASHIAFSELRRPTVKDIRLISEIHGETGFDLRYIFSEIQNFREIRKHTAEVEKHLVTRNSKRVYELYSGLQTVESVMSSFDPEESGFFEGKTTAVIGVDLFDDLDKHFIPLDADFVDMFDDGVYEIETIHEVGNDRQLADNAVDLIDPERADDYAIVLNSSSPLVDAVRTSLYRRGLPFINRMEVRDMAPIRDYLGFLTYAFNYDTVRIGQVRELLASFNGFVAQGTDGYLLSRLDEPALRPRAVELKDIMRRVCHEGMTFGEVRDLISYSSTRLHVTNLLKDLDLEDTTITPRELSNLRYAVENLSDLTNSEERHEDEISGVLIADCSRSVYVDRPIVLYLGMEQDWNVQVVGKRYLDVEEESEKNAIRLSALLQQGEGRVYLVNTTKNGKRSRPSLTFDMIFREPRKTFEDICKHLVTGRWSESMLPPSVGTGLEAIEQTSEFDRPFSKSSFDALVYCPRKYLFNSMLSDSDKKSTAFGNLVHEFAELYACYGELVRSEGMERFVDLAAERFAGLSSSSMADLDKDRIRVAMANIMAYMDRNGVSDVPLDIDEAGRKHGNGMMRELGLERCSSLCEKDEHSVKHPMHGKLDLFWKGTVCDYKTGKAKSPGQIISSMALGENIDYPEFQPLIYLALSQEREGSSGRFDLFYAMGHDTESISEGFDVIDNVRTVRLESGDAFSIAREDPGFMDDLRSDLSAFYSERAVGLLDGIEPYSSTDPSTWADNEDLLNNVRRNVGKDDQDKNVKAAVRKVADRFRNGMVRSSQEVIVPQETLDRFLEELDRMHDEVRAMSVRGGSGFPARPLKGCDLCGFREACTASIIEEGDDDE